MPGLDGKERGSGGVHSRLTYRRRLRRHAAGRMQWPIRDLFSSVCHDGYSQMVGVCRTRLEERGAISLTGSSLVLRHLDPEPPSNLPISEANRSIDGITIGENAEHLGAQFVRRP